MGSNGSVADIELTGRQQAGIAGRVAGLRNLPTSRQANSNPSGRFTSFIAVTALVVVGALTAIPPAYGEWEPSSYKERFETPKSGTRLEDNNVWVYTTGFAKRFGMPERWIDDDLEGAEAVAYRVEAKNTRSCGYFGDSENCRIYYRCIVDLYLTDAESRKLPWKSERVVDFGKGDTSVPFLSAQTRMDQKGWIEQEQRYDRSRLNIGLDTLTWVSGKPTDGKVYSAASDVVRVMAYDRKIFSGLDYLKLSTGCNFPARKSNVRIFFQTEYPTPTDYGYRYTEHGLNASPEDQKRFEIIKREWFEREFSGDVCHVVTFPDTFMARVNKYDRVQRAPKSLVREVERRSGGQGRNEAEKHWWQKLFGR